MAVKSHGESVSQSREQSVNTPLIETGELEKLLKKKPIMMDRNNLAALYKQNGILPEKEIVMYC